MANSPSLTDSRAGLLAAACVWLLAPSAAFGTSIAVRRGQAVVDPSSLPLVCLEIGTFGEAVPMDSITFENIDTHETEKRVLANSFNRSHPDILTANAPGPVSLSLPIMTFKPGRYRIMGIEMVGPGAGFTLDLSKPGEFVFEVKPGCVNYVGALQIRANWGALFAGASRRVEYNEVNRTSVASEVVAMDTTRRDVRWACTEVPGMLPLPLVISHIKTGP